MQVEIKEVGIDEAIRVMHKMAKTAKNIKPVHAHIGNILLNSIEQSFEDEGSPFGKKWTPSKKDNGKKTLTESGTLSSSFTVDADRTGVSVGTNLVYAAIHNFGGKAGRGKKVNIPARSFIPVEGGELESGVRDEIMEYLYKKLSS